MRKNIMYIFSHIHTKQKIIETNIYTMHAEFQSIIKLIDRGHNSLKGIRMYNIHVCETLP